jgi:hypothetical protein
MWLLLLGLLQIEGATACPTPQDVSARVAALLPDANRRTASVRLATRGDAFEVSLLDAHGRVRLSRTLERAGSCDDLAEMAALVIVVWQEEMFASVAATLPMRDPPSDAGGVPRQVQLVRAAQPPSRIRYQLAASFASAASERGDWAFGGTLEAILGAQRHPFAGHFGLLALSSREIVTGVPGGDVQVAWSRPALLLGGRFQFGFRRFRLDVFGDALLGLLVATGPDLSSPVYQFDPGLGGGLRVGWQRRPVELFVGFRAVGWLMQRDIPIERPALTTSVSPPRFDAVLSAGIALGSGFARESM